MQVQESPTPEITQLLERWQAGDRGALEALTAIVYEHLHRLAAAQMRDERAGHVLQTTALVHEAFLRLVGIEAPWQHRGHFYAMAAETMRRVLVDFARRRQAAKRGSGALRVTLDEADLTTDPGIEMLALDEALVRLARRDPRKVKIVELRCFAGLTIEETAQALGVGRATVENELRLARAWLARALRRGCSDGR
jgi:RNA polymerase sigma factor (TIGR02999 family)